MMGDLFESSKYSVAHAKRHVLEFKRLLKAFVESNPYAQVVELSDDGTEEIFKVKLIKQLPEAVPGVAFDAINSLRSSLDQLGYAIATAGGHSGRHAKFPFGDNLGEVESRRNGTSKHLPKEIFDFMISFKPYKGGNNPLWALNKLCNSHKHETVLAVASASGNSVSDVRLSLGHGVKKFALPPRWDSDKQEMEICRRALGAKLNYEMNISLFVALGSGDTRFPNPADVALDWLCGLVETIILATEAEAKRLGIVP